MQRLRATVVVAALAFAASGHPIRAEAETFENKIRVSPSHASNEDLFSVYGLNPCQDIEVIFSYTTFDGQTRDYAKRDTQAGKYDPSVKSDRFRFDDLRVPIDARPGSATVHVDGLCLPNAEARSDDVAFTIDKAQAKISISPPRPRPGIRATVSIDRCYGRSDALVAELTDSAGARSSLTLRKRAGATFSATATLTRDGDSSVRLIDPTGCPGSVAIGALRFRVGQDATTPPPVPGSPTPTPSESVAEVLPLPSQPSDPSKSRASAGAPVGLVVGASLGGATLVAAAFVIAFRRRRQPT